MEGMVKTPKVQDKAYAAAWYTKNKDRVLSRMVAYRKANPDKQKAWYQANKPRVLAYAAKHKERTRNNELKREFGITLADYNKMADQQGFTCNICHSVIEDTTGKARTLHVDHCHRTGTVRGLLCDACNLGLGYFKDSLGLLREAQQYLLDKGQHA